MNSAHLAFFHSAPRPVLFSAPVCCHAAGHPWNHMCHGVSCSNSSLRDSLRWLLGPGHLSLGQGTQHIQPEVDVPEASHWRGRAVDCLEDDEGVHHCRLQQPPTDVPPPLHRTASHWVVAAYLICLVHSSHVIAVRQDRTWRLHLLPAAWEHTITNECLDNWWMITNHWTENILIYANERNHV